MRFLATVAAAAACLTTALAQVNIAFTSVPVAAVVGQPTNITWGGGDGVTVRNVPRRCERLRSNS
jgi:phosphate-selective porin